MQYTTKGITKEMLISLYKNLLKPRLIEEKMLLLLRQGKISKWFSGIGQEAIPVGVTMALHNDEYILPLHRNLGVFISRKIPLHRLFSQWQGKMSGFTKERDRSFHFGIQEHNIIGMISHLGPQLGVTNGIALADLFKKNNKVTAVFTGDDDTSEGNFHEAFGTERVRNTPICESSIIEAAYGFSINGYKSVVELQFSDFITSGFNPVINLLAKSYYRWQQPADVVLRMPCGAGVGAGSFHSQTNEAWFTKTPGLKIVYPAFPYDAKGLLATAIADENPVLFFEHKALYRSVYQDVPDNYYTIPLGKACLLNEGNTVSIITYGAGVHWVLDTLKEISVDAI